MKRVGTPSDTNFERKEQEILIGYVRELFSNLADSPTDSLVEAVMDIAYRYDFDIDVLPHHLYEKVADRIQEEAEEDYYDDMMACLDADMDALVRRENKTFYNDWMGRLKKERDDDE